jgi:hypothetical protein
VTWKVGDTVYVDAGGHGVYWGVVHGVTLEFLHVVCLNALVPAKLATRPLPVIHAVGSCFREFKEALYANHISTLARICDLEEEYTKRREAHAEHIATLARIMEDT